MHNHHDAKSEWHNCCLLPILLLISAPFHFYLLSLLSPSSSPRPCLAKHLARAPRTKAPTYVSRLSPTVSFASHPLCLRLSPTVSSPLTWATTKPWRVFHWARERAIFPQQRLRTTRRSILISMAMTARTRRAEKHIHYLSVVRRHRCAAMCPG